MLVPLVESFGDSQRKFELPVALLFNPRNDTLLDWTLRLGIGFRVQLKAEHIINLSPTGRNKGKQANTTPSDESIAVKI